MCETITKKCNLHKYVRIIWKRNHNQLPPERNLLGVHCPNALELKSELLLSCRKNPLSVVSTTEPPVVNHTSDCEAVDSTIAEEGASSSNDRMMTRYRKRLSNTATPAIDSKQNRLKLRTSNIQTISREQLESSLGTPDFFTNGLKYFQMTKYANLNARDKIILKEYLEKTTLLLLNAKKHSVSAYDWVEDNKEFIEERAKEIGKSGLYPLINKKSS
ncbi:hypothetical protein B9Z55_025279 [Caenorhabditis nigoni]|uniref:Uncharacterized protein n=1 Tax=Caenorhabditis nigoni TaxID=1611254 RepID=A0A2G5SYI9_9PELO|nr:hypothetical protein B9Z55_025279 [Caenorhabditis nigoni]